MEIESIHISNNAQSKDGIEGLTAFSEKESLNLMNKNLLLCKQKRWLTWMRVRENPFIYTWKPDFFVFMEEYY